MKPCSLNKIWNTCKAKYLQVNWKESAKRQPCRESKSFVWEFILSLGVRYPARHTHVLVFIGFLVNFLWPSPELIWLAAFLDRFLFDSPLIHLEHLLRLHLFRKVRLIEQQHKERTLAVYREVETIFSIIIPIKQMPRERFRKFAR